MSDNLLGDSTFLIPVDWTLICMSDVGMSWDMLAAHLSGHLSLVAYHVGSKTLNWLSLPSRDHAF